MRTVVSFQRLALSVVLAMVFAGCVPVEKPPQLMFTPGAPFVVTGETLDAGAFHLRYPTGWRVISGQASTPITVIFVAPDDTALIMLSLSSIDAPPMLETGVQMRSVSRTVTRDNVTIAVYVTAPASEWDNFSPTFEEVLASITR